MSSEFEKQQTDSYLSGGNIAYIDALFEDYLDNPNSVSNTWRQCFDALPAVDGSKDVSHQYIRDYFLEKARRSTQGQVVSHGSMQPNVYSLIQAYRTYGHLIANLDPLDLTQRHLVDALDLAYHNLSEQDMDETFDVGGTFPRKQMMLREIYKALQDTYCGSIGIEYMHIIDSEQVHWFQEQMESNFGKPKFSADKKQRILSELIQADGLERYLGHRYVGQKRFSLEGGDALIPMMKEIIRSSGFGDVREIVIGMAHRGRLNVLINVLGKEPDVLFQEFEGKVSSDRTGDVKYHLGFSSNIRTENNAVVHVALAFNPSHLEIIGPVVEGSSRSRLRRRKDLIEKKTVLPVVIHGDAAFCGQGVVMETFNLSQARGYCTGGTVHIVINNQIGFTTSNPLDARSSIYCTDVAKMIQAPVIHVNGNDPEAVVFVTQIAFAYRQKFKRDIVIDLVCYRKNGHNEADEPSLTQPEMYKKIKSMQPLRDIYAEDLVQQGIVTNEQVEQWTSTYRNIMDQGKAVVDTVSDHYDGQLSVDWAPFLHAKWTDKVETSVPKVVISELSKKLQDIPDNFTLHPIAKRLMTERASMSDGDTPMNWGYAETMAYATLLNEGYGVRLSGQDSGRGTFAHRHAVLHDAKTAEVFVPLEHILKNSAHQFTVIDSVLSEAAVLAYEYGYAASEPNSLVIWEAQFGDFANGAQVVIDQFISSGEQKWGRLCGLVMLLPHGYEGQGPEHSSARLERYLQLCAQHNIQVCSPTTPAQMFHLLRRQMVRKFRKPLIVMTPKSLLRNKLTVSPLSDLYKGHFHTVIPEIDAFENSAIKKVIMCSGKVYYDLLQKRRDEEQEHIAIIRIEQLYPFPKDELTNILSDYPHAKTVVWCQEEPKNQGAWYSSQHNMQDCLQGGQNLVYAGRPYAASPAVGSPILHAKEQKALLEQAFSDGE